uniref:Uncharacterized protein n=1 Tax=Megaselia scalaris TaxID=36166 RepID=T1H535_MEGSC
MYKLEDILENDEQTAPTRTEVDNAIQRLKNNKRAGSDGIPTEMFKGDQVSTVKYWNSEGMPEERTNSIT